MAAVADWVVISDFTPGIFTDYHVGSSGVDTAAPRNGAAVASGTWRCTADKSGALVPLPGRTTTYSQNVPFTEAGRTGVPAGFPGGVPRAMLLDAVVMSPILPQKTSMEPFAPDAVYILWGALYDHTLGGSGFRQYVIGKALGPFGGNNWDFMFAQGANSVIFPNISYPSASMDKGRTSVIPGNYDPVNYRPNVIGTISFDRVSLFPAVTTGAMSVQDQGLTDFDTVPQLNSTPAPAVAYFPGCGFQTPVTALAAPLASVGTITGASGLGNNSPLCVGHQGRVVYSRRNPTPFYGPGGTPVGWFLSDFLTYTNVGDYGTGADAIFGEENPSPIGVLMSMNANELLIVKHAGGAVLVRGDIANPQVIRLPLVHSTGGYTMRAAHTPVGVFWGTRHGVVRWEGGDTSEIVSRQLEGDFWVPQTGGEVMEGHRARFSFWHPWLMVPNDWLLDTNTGAWWRLEDPADVPFGHGAYDHSANGQLYAFRHKVQGTGSQPWYDTYNPESLASSWQWRSQPLLDSREREDNYGEIEIIAQRGTTIVGPHTSTITVTLTGFRGDGTPVTSTNVFTLAANQNPQALVQAVNTNFTARFVQVTIAAASGSSSAAAPKLFSIRLGRNPRNRLPRG